jgi:hypothetical protein
VSQYISGVFDDRDEANNAVDELLSLGYKRDDVSILMNSEARARYFGDDTGRESTGDNIARGAAGGGMIGGTIGAIVGALTLTGAIGAAVATGGAAAPLVAGPLAAALAGGGAGAAAGSVIGGLAGAGIPEGDRVRIERGVQSGQIVVAVKAKDEDADQVRRILGSDDLRRGAGTFTSERDDSLDQGNRQPDTTTFPDVAGAGAANRGTLGGFNNKPDRSLR